MRKTIIPVVVSLMAIAQGCCSNNSIRVTPQMQMDGFLFRAKMYTQWFDLWHLSKSEGVIDVRRFPNPGGWDIVFGVLVAEGEYWDGYAGTDVDKPEGFKRTLVLLRETQNQVKEDLEEWRSDDRLDESVEDLTIQEHLTVYSLSGSD